MVKEHIRKALREQVWLKHCGKKFEHKCYTNWCTNIMTVFNFDCGHDIPESKGGETILENLFPICRNCNLSMGNSYTFKEWNQLSKPTTCCQDLWRFAFKGSGSVLAANPTSPKDKPMK